jgi:predicted nucleotidyltransferase
LRLSDFYQETIKSTGLEIFGNDTKIYLFGSRADNTKRGGDIDLYIDVINKNDPLLFDKKIKFLTRLQKTLGDQKIDVLISKDKNRPIEQVALRDGVQL